MEEGIFLLENFQRPAGLFKFLIVIDWELFASKYTPNGAQNKPVILLMLL